MGVSRLNLVYKKSPNVVGGSKDAVRYGGQSCWICRNAAYTSRFLKASGTSLKPLEMTAAMMRPTMNQLTPTP